MRAGLLCLMLLVPWSVAAQEFFTLKGHGGPIMDIAVDATGQIATASFDNSVGLWEAAAPRWLEGHDAAVNVVRFIAPGLMVSGGDDFSVRLWRDGSQSVLGRHEGKVMSLAVSPDGGTIASASWDGSIGVWQVSGGAGRMLRGHGQGVNSVAFSADASRLYSASTDGTIRIWDVASGQEMRQLVKHGFGVNKLLVHEADGWLAYGAVDGGTRLVDLETADVIADFTLGRRPVLALAFHAATHQMAVGDGEGYIMVVNTQRRRITRDFRATSRGPIWALAFSPDGQNIHAGGIADVMYSWPVETMDTFGQMDTSDRTFLEDPATLPNGERQFKRKCSICHALTPGSARKAGPTLYALFGRPAGKVDDYSYSNILTGSDIVWSEETIDQLFDIGPDHYIPGTKMPMQRIVGVNDRRDLIAYLKEATAPSDHREDTE